MENIGSAALVADGIEARTDGFTSLAVVLGALGVESALSIVIEFVGGLLFLFLLLTNRAR